MGPKIALIGCVLESNAFAPPTVEANFRRLCYFEGEAIPELARQDPSPLPAEFSAFIDRMDGAGPWQPVPILVAAAEPGGPIDQGLLERFEDEISSRLEQAGAVDGVYFCAHGAMTATGESDPDGRLWSAVRRCVGPNVPIVATVDLHANISDRMVESVDVLISYLTNPHVDQKERAVEAADHLCELISGETAHASFIRLPLAPPSITLLTAEGPYADLIAYGQSQQTAQIMNVSVVGGFAFSDTNKNGIAVIVTSRDDPEPAQRLAADIANRGWSMRERFVRQLVPMREGINRSLDRTVLPAIYSDAGDNPGGGGRGNTSVFLKQLLDADVQDVLYGLFIDPALAAEATSLGPGAEFEARFNRDHLNNDRYGPPIATPAEVLAVHDGNVVGSRGLWEGRQLSLGPTVALDLGGVTVVVSTARKQCADPVFFTMMGLDIRAAHTVVVKSRGHFRAGFDIYFPPERVLEIDTPGLTSPVLSRFEFKNMPRPVFPIDKDAVWTPPRWALPYLDRAEASA
ncbi:MAG: M81 family metallopeptidase [Pseudomonadota bacterium]